MVESPCPDLVRALGVQAPRATRLAPLPVSQYIEYSARWLSLGRTIGALRDDSSIGHIQRVFFCFIWGRRFAPSVGRLRWPPFASMSARPPPETPPHPAKRAPHRR